MAVQTDFMAAVNQIAAERGIEVKEVVEAIAEAIKAGFITKYTNGEESDKIKIEVDINAEHGEIAVYQIFAVVEDVVDADTEMTEAEAKKHDKSAKVGKEIKIDITPEGDFGRVAAQSAKQAILQKIREVEKETQLREFTDRVGEVEYAVVQRMDGDNVIWEIGKTIAVMPQSERIVNEFYKSGNRHKVLIKAIEETPRGKALIVSRAAPEFLQALFELEIPELTSESIEIKSIAREAGSRSKVAVVSNVEGIDPIGSCVGQKGMRINAIMNELKFGMREEKIDIILWDENDQKFIGNAVSPAEAKKVEIVSKEDATARITVPDEQLSLAIGKDGQNVRLAAKLTGWKLDIVSDGITAEGEEGAESTEVTETNEESSESTETADGLSSLGLSTRIVNILSKAGITTVEELEKYKDDFTQIDGIAKKSAEDISAALK
jgi:transcription termination/antitermination protein NusA